MTALRPERDSAAPYGEDTAYGDAAAYGGAAAPEQEWYDPQGYARDWYGEQTASPEPSPYQEYAQYAEPQLSPSYRGTLYEEHQYAEHQQAEPTYDEASYAEHQHAERTYNEPQRGEAWHEEPHSPSYEPPPIDEETVALRVPDSQSIPAAPTRPATGGRAARRKSAKRHGRHGASGGSGGAQERSAEPGAAPLSRMEARRAARAQKPGAAVLASRAIGEVFITTGVLMLLFVTYQLWWTNIRAHAQAGSEANSLQNDWASGKRNPGAFEPGQGFALLHIPKLDVVVPIAEGIDKKRVLDRGMVGHYAEKTLATAMPDAKTGNFGLAGHRNTHGEPFRYINRLKPGDPIVVETQDKYFVYKMASILPVTSPANTAVLDAIPKGSGFTTAGRYITLTTCTPEFTSKYRMIVWGKMVEERQRSKGKPDALVE
ncbi:class E sortase [Streptomyces sporangiiformans]|uniref:Class E sortase n=1 Tax=Streptomyces sporangiiformans TaxID=2315329 RepID=A0A505DHN3_9ACTN|nr:class E sortase [Streptomyces sporangiiformans]TPQ21295.1 class E sortase [Streptomyces sporangiiformans]